MAQIERNHRDSILRGRGYSVALGTNNVLLNAAGGSNHQAIVEEESMSPSGLLLDDDDDEDDLLLDGADDNLLLEDFEKDGFSKKLVSFDRAIESDQ